jgi:hypothetical protein
MATRRGNITVAPGRAREDTPVGRSQPISASSACRAPGHITIGHMRNIFEFWEFSLDLQSDETLDRAGAILFPIALGCIALPKFVMQNLHLRDVKPSPPVLVSASDICSLTRPSRLWRTNECAAEPRTTAVSIHPLYAKYSTHQTAWSSSLRPPETRSSR